MVRVNLEICFAVLCCFGLPIVKAEAPNYNHYLADEEASTKLEIETIAKLIKGYEDMQASSFQTRDTKAFIKDYAAHYEQLKKDKVAFDTGRRKPPVLKMNCKLGDIGCLSGGWTLSGDYKVRVVQVIDQENMIIAATHKGATPDSRWFWMKYPTAGVADESVLNITKLFCVADTRSYTTTAGSKKTLFVLEPVPDPAMKAIEAARANFAAYVESEAKKKKDLERAEQERKTAEAARLAEEMRKKIEAAKAEGERQRIAKMPLYHMSDGREIRAAVVMEMGKELIIKDETGKTHQVKKSDVKEVVKP